MIDLCPLQVWCSSVHSPLRSIRGFGPRWKIWWQKCAKSWISQLRIVWFRSNFTEGLDTWHRKYHKSSSSRGQRSRSQRDVTRAKICQIVNNSAGDCSISINLVQTITTCHQIYQTFKVNGSKVKVIAWYEVLAWKNRYISWTYSLAEFKHCVKYLRA